MKPSAFWKTFIISKEKESSQMSIILINKFLLQSLLPWCTSDVCSKWSLLLRDTSSSFIRSLFSFSAYIISYKSVAACLLLAPRFAPIFEANVRCSEHTVLFVLLLLVALVFRVSLMWAVQAEPSWEGRYIGPIALIGWIGWGVCFSLLKLLL